jgi:adenosine kinase
VHSPEGVAVIPAAPVSDVLDPTGAGDAYIAGLVTGFRAGASPDVAGRMGSLAAAYVVEQHGPQRHRFDMAGFRERYAVAFGSPLSLPSKTAA